MNKQKLPFQSKITSICEFHEIFNKQRKATKTMRFIGGYGSRIVNLCKPCYNRFAIMQFEAGSKRWLEKEKGSDSNDKI